MATTHTIPGHPSMTAERRREVFQDMTKAITLVATDTTQDAFLAKKANYTIWVQRIVVWISTSAAQSMTFQDDAGTPLVVAVVPSSPGANTRWDFDFGPVGRPLGENQDLDITLSAAGLAGSVIIYAYRAPSSPITASAGASSQ